jgi:hypothetical protein
LRAGVGGCRQQCLCLTAPQADRKAARGQPPPRALPERRRHPGGATNAARRLAVRMACRPLPRSLPPGALPLSDPPPPTQGLMPASPEASST